MKRTFFLLTLIVNALTAMAYNPAYDARINSDYDSGNGRLYLQD